MAQDLVIGSGPAGVAAAVALVQQGRRVTILDVGEKIEPERAALQSRLALLQPDQWDSADIDAIRAPSHAEGTDGGRPFGSSVQFRDSVGFAASSNGLDKIGLKPSFAQGGLSNGWGAAVLPYRSEDMKDWPIGEDELAPHYDALRSFVPIASRRDDLADLFPLLNVRQDTALPPSTQAAKLLKRFNDRRESLKETGIHFGMARQAVSNECRQCAMCLYGCPYRLIFNASHVLERLVAAGQVEYQRGHYALRFEESPDGVRVWSHNLPSAKIVEHTGSRLFVATGVLPTAKLVLESLNCFDHPVVLLDSHHFLLPTIHSWWPRPDPATVPHHTLTQLFIEILDPAVAENLVHFQLYTHNDHFAADMRQRLSPFAGLMKPAIEHLSRRLVVAQGFLHSDDSARIELKLMQTGSTSQLSVRPIRNPRTALAVKRVLKKWRTITRAVGLYALFPLLRPGSPGSSFHCGGTFPMRRDPEGLETDVLGRPAGLRRVFLVDASVFPSVPASTITLSVMANAHRIATSATNDA